MLWTITIVLLTIIVFVIAVGIAWFAARAGAEARLRRLMLHVIKQPNGARPTLAGVCMETKRQSPGCTLSAVEKLLAESVQRGYTTTKASPGSGIYTYHLT